MDPEHVAGLVSTATVSLLHSLLPSHWLCFALAGRARGWSLGRTIGMTAIAGSCHVLSTVALGVIVIVLGKEILPEERMETVSAGILIGVGSLFLLLQVLRKGHKHAHDLDRLALTALILTPTLSPCSAVIPMFLAVAGGGVLVVGLAAGVLMVTTLGTMILLVTLSSLGVDKLRFSFVDRYEKALIGAILCLLGLLILLFHQPHAVPA